MVMELVGYVAKCKKCGWIFAESKQSNIKGMPAKCPTCEGDMGIESIMRGSEEGKGLTYEFTVFCKETGVTVRDSMTLIEQDIKEVSDSQLIDLFQLRAADCMIRIIGASKDKKDKKNLDKLLGRNV